LGFKITLEISLLKEQVPLFLLLFKKEFLFYYKY
jgi:hypothetical protein